MDLMLLESQGTAVVVNYCPGFFLLVTIMILSLKEASTLSLDVEEGAAQGVAVLCRVYHSQTRRMLLDSR